VAVCRVDAPAVVLGSTQSADVVDVGRAAAAGFEVARRRSGGGAVLVTPDDPVWIDVWLPVSHPLWSPDVGRAFDWLGDVWVAGLRAVGIDGLSAHRQGFVSCTRWSTLVCFGGVGTGEVVTGDGRKVVGLAQRRNREGAWFHGACVLRWDPVPLLGVLAMEADERRAAADGLGEAVVGVSELAASADPLSGTGRPAPDGPAVVSAFIDALP
jgi:lipoate-protein ligase A